MPEPMVMQEDRVFSVIITCYNHGQYLPDAINSILQQTDVNPEIIVVDDGSTDNTREVTLAFSTVKYVFQENQGLSAARNTGIDHSTGQYLVFLDADDWMLKRSLSTNLQYLREQPDAAFVSGAFTKVYQPSNRVEEIRSTVNENHYLRLLQGNYIGMHATVLYARWIFDHFRFDTSLRACEDYDIYLKIARKFKVIHHDHLTAAYRIHSSNMSSNAVMMLKSVEAVLNRHHDTLINKEEQLAYQQGVKNWKNYYNEVLYYTLLDVPYLGSRNKIVKEGFKALWSNSKPLYAKYLIRRPMRAGKKVVTKFGPSLVLRWLHKKGILKEFVPRPGTVNMGDLDRTKPFSIQFGYDRGGPVDRFYIENFLQQNSHSIHGRVLEIGDNEYTIRFGGSQVKQSDVLHINNKNPKATFVGDLSDAPHLPNDSFDCIVLTQTLQFIFNYVEALKTCYRILKPGGVLLLTVPGISHIDQGEWNKIWFWSFTDIAISRILSEIFPPRNINVETYGNVFSATAFLYGMGLPEVDKAKLQQTDPHYQVIISAEAIKPVNV